jgi:predicted ATP-grasp superfamily ATP-dependent carboligase
MTASTSRLDHRASEYEEETVRTIQPRSPRNLRDGAGRPAPEAPAAPVPADLEAPALIVKIGRYPLHHGGVGAIRTLGRLGIPVYAITEDSFTPAAVSRYCRGSFVWPTTGREDPDRLVDELMEIGKKIGRRTVAVPTDEEAAVLLAEHASRLSAHFLLPDVQPSLPRKLASKQGLYELCREHGVPTPGSAFPATPAALASFASQASFPVVAKNLEAWVRRQRPAVAGTTIFGTEQELLAAAGDWGAEPSVILQEYIPREQAQDWIVHLYCDADSNCLVEFTGIKMRSWPPHAGMTACARTVPNPALARAAARFCKRIGFSGIADLDWRLDLRDGKYKLLDFNPRVGAQFRLFETEAGLDVVRAMHLDLSGRPVPASPQVNGRKLVVENIDPLARLAYRGQGRLPGLPVRTERGRKELAWIATDDPLPFVAMSARLIGPAIAHLSRALRSRKLRRRAAREARAGIRTRDQDYGAGSRFRRARDGRRTAQPGGRDGHPAGQDQRDCPGARHDRQAAHAGRAAKGR